MKLKSIVKQIVSEAEKAAQEDALSAAMGQAFKNLESEFESHEDEIKKDVEDADIKITEAIGVLAVLGFVLAAPKVLELITKALSGLVGVFKKSFRKGQAKTEEEQSKTAAIILNFSHKWHKAYIKGLKWIFKMSGLYVKAGIKDEASQMKAAELVYYIIIAALAVYSGVGAFSAFKSAVTAGANVGNVSLGALETAMASVKSGEVASFIAELGLK